MKIIESRFSHSFGTMALAVVILGVFAFISNVFAWTPAPLSPLNSNVSVSLHQSSLAQSKSGGLILNTGNVGTNGVGTNGLIVQYGKVGIGITSPTQTLDVEGNVRAAREHVDYICNRAGTQCLSFATISSYITSH